MVGETIDVFVPGVPKPQGSMRLVNRRTGKMVHSDGLTEWRTALIFLLRTKSKGIKFPTGPVELAVIFSFQRPKSHTKATVAADVGWKPRGSDLDKLVRAVCDACTYAGVIGDDTQIVLLTATKVYGERDGAMIRLGSLAGESAPGGVPGMAHGA